MDQITIDNKFQMSSLLVFNRVYRLEIQSVMLVFSAPLVNQRPSNLVTGSLNPSSLPCVNKYTGMYSNSVLQGGGRDQVGRGPQTDKHLPLSTFTGQFLGFGVFIDIWSMDSVDDAEVRQSLYSFYAGSKSVHVFIWLHSIGPDFSSPLIHSWK